jgi:hypothetical protein
MDGLKTDAEGISLVLVGSFNPAIYHPEWFGRRGLIRDEEVKSATLEVVHNEITSQVIGSIKIQVRSDRFMASTANAGDYEVLRDLVEGTFKILPDTPIRMMGINFDAHYRMPSIEAWHALGHRLAPKELWTPILEKPGTVSLTIEGDRDAKKGYLRVKVESSARIKNGVGVYINVNDHYEIVEHKPEDGCAEIMEKLTANWAPSLKRSRSITEAIARS